MNIINVTEAATKRIIELMSLDVTNAIGIKIGIKQGGCSGLSYTFEYTQVASHGDEVLNIDSSDFKLIIDSKAIIFIIGTTLDYSDSTLKSGFIFINPNETGRCGCGSSLSTK